MKNFSVVQEHFKKLRCAHCSESFTPDGVKLLREEKDYWFVKVHCTSCNQPAGVAIVGVEYESAESPVGRDRSELAPLATSGYNTRSRAVFSSKREEERFSKLDPISPDEVLDAHKFFSQLGSNWSDLLPKRR